MTAMMNDGHRVMIADAGQKVSEAMLRGSVPWLWHCSPPTAA
jgi:hypothetical protein